MTSKDNVIIFIPLEMETLKNNEQQIQAFQGNEPMFMNPLIEENVPINDDDLIYNPQIQDHANPFEINPVNTPQKEGNFSNLYIQLNQCNTNLEWAISTNLHCYNCQHPFLERPWYLPVEYIDECFIVEPIFCSPACVLRYNMDSGHPDYSKRVSLFYLMYNFIYESNVNDLPIALSPKVLDIYGGPMNIVDYRKYSEIKDKKEDMVVEYPDVYSIVPMIHYIKRKKPEQYNKKQPPPILRNTTRSVFDTLIKKKITS